jgi:hypothetical protein
MIVCQRLGMGQLSATAGNLNDALVDGCHCGRDNENDGNERS